MASTLSTTPTTPAPILGSRKRAWAVTGMILLLNMINFGDKAVLGLAAKPIRQSLDLDATQFGAISSSFYFLFSLAALLVGFISRRVSTTAILGTIAVLWSVATLPILLAASVPMLYLSRIALGATEGPTAPIAAHAVQKWFPDRSRAVPTALTTMGGALGLVITAPTLSYFIVHHGWHSAFAVLAVAGIVWAAVWYFVGKEGPYTTYQVDDAPAAKDGGGEHHVKWARIFLSRTWLGQLVAGATAYFALAVATAWLPSLLEDGRGYSAQTTSFLVSLPHIVSAVMILVVPFFAERLMRRGIGGRWALGGAAGGVILISGVCALLAASMSGAPMIILLSIGFGLPSAFYPLAFLIGARISPVGQRGAVLCTGTAIVTMAGVFGPAVTGRVIDTAGGTGAGFGPVLTLTGVLLIIGGAVGVAAIHPDADARRFGLRA